MSEQKDIRMIPATFINTDEVTRSRNEIPQLDEQEAADEHRNQQAVSVLAWLSALGCRFEAKEDDTVLAHETAEAEL